MKWKIPLFLVCAGVLALGGVSNVFGESAPVQVLEKDIQFQPGDIRVKAGQTIQVINKDPFRHLAEIRKVNRYGIEYKVVAGGTIEHPGDVSEMRVNEPG
ncbi:MAG: hypothetical protein GWM98_07880, partial [Nitrospinaceae bacterium]|nr:hypothetical protein [Nitrospinaceae bacterium]NIR54432.1 hypothetical protein [Nitrospinaceae bacterium]NIS86527.1 hypothetical protein [Nitrospinaceae bacterium]NIT81654.1 hypothetical protein [Nitrospinaceae bacterium]NIU45571.1 hypothetical protein [Nitrospinaceae bacterium]